MIKRERNRACLLSRQRKTFIKKAFSLRSLSMLAIAILGLFLVFMAVMNIIDFGRVD